MAVTAIRSIANRTATTYLVANLEHPADTGGAGQHLEIVPGVNRRVHMWIPWCDNQAQLDGGKRIVLEGLAVIEQELGDNGRQLSPEIPAIFTVWQSGDYVYVSLDDRFDAGRLVLGDSTVGGDRSVEIRPDGLHFG